MANELVKNWLEFRTHPIRFDLSHRRWIFCITQAQSLYMGFQQAPETLIILEVVCVSHWVYLAELPQRPAK